MGTMPSSARSPVGLTQSHEKEIELNAAPIIKAAHQHEVAQAAEQLNPRLQAEVAAREKAVRELAEKARLLDLTEDAIIVRDIEGRISYWNHGAEILYGWSREEALGKKSHDLLQAESQTPFEEIAQELSRNGRWTGELVHTKRDGQRITVLARKTLDRDSQGNPAAVLQTLTDISERKRVEEVLRRSEQFNRSIIDSSPDCIKVLDLEGNLLSMESGRELLGIEDITPYLNTSWLEFWTGDDRMAARRAVQEAAAGREGNFIGFFRTFRGDSKWWGRRDLADPRCARPARAPARHFPRRDPAPRPGERACRARR